MAQQPLDFRLLADRNLPLFSTENIMQSIMQNKSISSQISQAAMQNRLNAENNANARVAGIAAQGQANVAQQAVQPRAMFQQPVIQQGPSSRMRTDSSRRAPEKTLDQKARIDQFVSAALASGDPEQIQMVASLDPERVLKFQTELVTNPLKIQKEQLDLLNKQNEIERKAQENKKVKGLKREEAYTLATLQNAADNELNRFISIFYGQDENDPTGIKEQNNPLLNPEADFSEIAALNRWVGAWGTDGRMADSIFRGMIDGLIRAATGAAVQKDEWDNYYKAFMPYPLDNDEEAAKKIQRLNYFIKNVSSFMKTGKGINKSDFSKIENIDELMNNPEITNKDKLSTLEQEQQKKILEAKKRGLL